MCNAEVRFTTEILSYHTVWVVSSPWRFCKSCDRFCSDSGTNLWLELIGMEFCYRLRIQPVNATHYYL